jgi:L-fuculose-phosphate aldolase
MAEKKDTYKIKLFQDEVARGIQIMHRQGLLPNDKMGDISIRDAESGNVFISIKPGTFYIKDPSDYHGSDIAVVDKNGHPLTDLTPPSDNLPMHLAVYDARPDVNAILHTFPVWTSLMSERKMDMPFVLAEQLEMSINVGCVTVKPSADKAYYAEIIKKLKEEKFVLLYRCGALSVADNIDNAINYLAWMESVSEKFVLASMIGTPHLIG